MKAQISTTKNIPGRRPPFAAAQSRLLERLCTACAVSGDEGEVRAIVLEQLQEHVRSKNGEVEVDALGNVLVNLPGSSTAQGARPRVMLAAHMDEVGFMITQAEEDGIYRFETVGSIDVRQIVGKPVWIGRQHIPGVIGAKPIHLTRKDEIKSIIPLDTLRIDTGLGKTKVQIGDRAAFTTPYLRLGPSLLAKALDNRLGVLALIELVKNAPTNIDLLAAFTVQEEVGGRGARVAAYAFNPDMAIALDSTPAYDLPVWDDTENAVYNTRLGHGPAIYLADPGTLSDPRLIRHLVQNAEAAGIPYQFRQPGGGGTDAGAIHLQRNGIPSISVSVPSRYQHTAASICRISDWQDTLSLLQVALASLTPALLAGERA
jgi:tetrahedral aminopeptidase